MIGDDRALARRHRLCPLCVVKIQLGGDHNVARLGNLWVTWVLRGGVE